MDEYDIRDAFEAIEEELIASMMRNMKRHKVEEISEQKQWEMWQVLQLQALERYKERNREKFGKKFTTINEKIEDMIRKANASGMMEQEVEILKAINDGFLDYKKASEAMQGRFFRVNERKLDALIEATINDTGRAETAVLRLANDEYRKAIFNAATYATTGAGTYEKAVDMAMKDFLTRGLACVEYKNGARHSLSDYADMAIKTATTRAYLQGEGTMRQKWGIPTVILNKRTNACPKCAPFAGKIFIDDVWSGGKKSDGRYPLISEAIAQGLYHPRCKDTHTTYFPKLGEKSEDTYSRKELQQIEQKAQKEARQQYAERQEKKYERLEKYSLEEKEQKHYEEMRKAESKTGDKNTKEYLNEIENKKIKCKNITNHYLETATPKSHEIEYLDRITHNGIEYIVDGKNVLLDPEQKEIRVAKNLREILGGKIAFRPRVIYPQKISSADLEFKNELFDIKCVEGAGKHTLYGMVSKKKEQAVNFIFDISTSPLTEEQALDQIFNDVFRSTHTSFVRKIILMDGNKLIGVYERI